MNNVFIPVMTYIIVYFLFSNEDNIFFYFIQELFSFRIFYIFNICFAFYSLLHFRPSI